MTTKTENDLSPRRRALAAEFVKEGWLMQDAIDAAARVPDDYLGFERLDKATSDPLRAYRWGTIIAIACIALSQIIYFWR